MWNIESLWFEVALVSTIFAVGGIFFGHFEEFTPRWRRVLKFLIFVTLVPAISAYFGRLWAFGFLGTLFVAGVYVHGFYLPSKGINGLTGEPREKYYALKGWPPRK